MMNPAMAYKNSAPLVSGEKIDAPMVLLYILSISGYPLATVIANVIGADNREVSIIFRGCFLLFAVWLFVDGLLIRRAIFKGWFWPPYLVFFLLYGFRIYWDCFVESVPTAYDPQLYFMFLFGVTLIPSLAFARRISLETSVRTMKAILVTLVATQIMFTLTNREALFLSSEGQRVQTEALNAISFGTIGGITVIISIFLMLGRNARSAFSEERLSISDIFFKIALVCCAALGFYTIFLSGSRGPLLSATLVFVVLVLTSYGDNLSDRLAFLWKVIALLLVTMGAFVVFFAEATEVVFQRISATLGGQEMSDIGRFDLWKDGFSEFLDSPFVGSGFEVSTLTFYPHNLPLEALMATGLIGGGVWVIMCWVGIGRAVQVIRTAPDYAWIGVLAIYLFSNSLFSGSLWNSGSIAHFMVALFAIPIARSAR